MVAFLKYYLFLTSLLELTYGTAVFRAGKIDDYNPVLKFATTGKATRDWCGFVSKGEWLYHIAHEYTSVFCMIM